MAVHGAVPSTRREQVWTLWAASITPRRGASIWLADVELEPYQALLVRR